VEDLWKVVALAFRRQRTETKGQPMARTVRNQKLDTPSARAKLKPGRYWISIAPGCAFGYRKQAKGGVWAAKLVKGNLRRETTIGPADDVLAADGKRLALNFTQAQENARAWYFKAERGEVAEESEPLTLARALDQYEADLSTRDGDIGNVVRVRKHLTTTLSSRPVADLTEAELKRWRDGMMRSLAPASVNRTTTALKAALNLAADLDKRVVSRRPWEIGLATLPGAEQSRNVILADDVVRRLIAAAYEHSQHFGLLVEVAAVTGARYSQLAKLRCEDLQDGKAPRLMVPASAKGKGKVAVRRPVPIGAPLAARLARAAEGRPATVPLLTKLSGQPWRKSDHARLFARAAARCGLNPDEVTIYALRHSSIVRAIKGQVPIRVVAVSHDTSVAMIERHYSAEIADFTDEISRGAMLATGAEVVPLRVRG
jgi:integrase